MLRQLLLILMLCLTSAAVDAAARPALFTIQPPGDGTVRLFRGNVVVFDLATNLRVGSPVLLPGGVAQILAAQHSDRAYVVTRDEAFRPTIATISLSTASVIATFAIGERGGVGALLALSPDERLLYTANSGTIAVVDVAANAMVRQQLVGGVIDAFAVSTDGTKLYIPGGSQLRAIDTSTFGTTFLPYPRRAVNVVPSPDGSRLYIVNEDATVGVYDLATNTVIAFVPVGAAPFAAAISADGRVLYVGNGGANSVTRIDTATLARATFPVPVKPTLLSAAPDAGRLLVGQAAQTGLWVLDGATGQVVKAVDGVWLLGGISPTMPASANGAPFGDLIVEYYRPALDHYFMTADGKEISDLDTGVHAGWTRTGEDFLAWRSGESGGAGNPVCRFYGLPAFGLDSHFYSGSPSECHDVGTNFGGAWLLETDNAFEVTLPDLATGVCPNGMDPIYRLWNKRVDSNHRYTARSRYAMVARGWVPEGYGPLGVAMCARR